MAEGPPTPPASASEPSSSAAAPRRLPLTLLLPPPSNGRRGLGGVNGRAATARRAAGSGERGRKKGRVPDSSAAAETRGDRLVEAVRVVGRDLDAGVTGADILELAMAKGPMFSWLTYWPEEGYPKEDHPY